MNEKKRNYKKENEKAMKNNFRVNLKINKKYKSLVDEIKEDVGITDFFIDNLKKYKDKDLVLTMIETATLITIVENFIETHKDYEKIDNGKYINEVKKLLKKINEYYKKK